MTRNIFLIMQRAYLTLVGTWGFWIGMLSMPVMIGIVIIISVLAQTTSETRYYVVLEQGKTIVADAIYEEISDRKNITIEEQEQLLESSIDSLTDPSASSNLQTIESDLGTPDYKEIKSPVKTIEDLRPWLSGEQKLEYRQKEVDLFAAILVPQGNRPIQYWSQNVTDDRLVGIVRNALYELARREVFEEKNVPLTIMKDVDDAVRKVEERRLREEGDDQSSEVTFSDKAPYITALALSFLLWITIFSAVTSLLMGTIEEKSNRLFDCLLTSVRLPELLAGKMLAIMFLSLTIYSVWAVVLISPIVFFWSIFPAELIEITSALLDSVVNPAILLPTLLCFILGYVMYGSLFMAIGALCESEQDSQSLVSPMVLLLMTPIFVLTTVAEDLTNPLVGIVSWIPLFTPFLLILRIPTEASLFEIIGQFMLMAATSAAILAGSVQLFKAGVIHGLDISGVAGWIKSIVKQRR